MATMGQRQEEAKKSMADAQEAHSKKEMRTIDRQCVNCKHHWVYGEWHKCKLKEPPFECIGDFWTGECEEMEAK